MVLPDLFRSRAPDGARALKARNLQFPVRPPSFPRHAYTRHAVAQQHDALIFCLLASSSESCGTDCAAIFRSAQQLICPLLHRAPRLPTVDDVQRNAVTPALACVERYLTLDRRVSPHQIK